MFGPCLEAGHTAAARGESIRDTLARVVPCHLARMLPVAMRGVTLVVFHGNALRALVTAIEDLAPEAVERPAISTGLLRLYHLAPDTTIEAREILDCEVSA